jgi:hypothetical protein
VFRLNAILIARSGIIDGHAGMGAKYLPTIKDRKASQRFLQQRKRLPVVKKPSAEQPAKKDKKP